MSTPGSPRTLRLACLVSHPIQYQAPLFRRIAATPGVDLTVCFMSDHGVRPTHDPGMGRIIQFDVPLLGGYEHVFLPNLSPRPQVSTVLGEINPSIVSLLARAHFDALWVHGYTEATTWLGYAAARALGIPYLVRGESTLLFESDRSPAVRAVKRTAVGRLVRGAASLLFIGELNRKFYEAYGARSEQLTFAPYSVDNGYFADRAGEARVSGASDLLRKTVAAKSEDVLLLFTGKLQARKRPADLVEALTRLGPHVVAVFLGDGELRSELERAIEHAGVRAHILGFVNQSELPAWYAAADLLVLPSEHETWGLVVNEAMACGLPAVVSDKVGCMPDLVRDRHSGASFRAGDVGSLVRALTPFVDSADRRWSASRAAHDTIASYDVSVTAAGIVEAARNVARAR